MDHIYEIDENRYYSGTAGSLFGWLKSGDFLRQLLDQILRIVKRRHHRKNVRLYALLRTVPKTGELASHLAVCSRVGRIGIGRGGFHRFILYANVELANKNRTSPQQTGVHQGLAYSRIQILPATWPSGSSSVRRRG